MNMLHGLYSYIDKKADDKYYVYKLSFWLLIISWILARPLVFLFFTEGVDSPAWKIVLLKAADLTNNLNHLPPYSWLAKKVFRLTIPALIKVFKLTPGIIVATEIILGYLIYVFSYKLSLRVTKDKVQSTLLTIGVTFLYFGRAAYYSSFYCWFDAFSYFFLIMAMYNRNIFMIFLFSTLAAWNDERAFIALSLVLLFHYLENNEMNKLQLKQFFKTNQRVLSVIVAIILYLLTRIYLTYQFDMHTPSQGASFHTFHHKNYNYYSWGLLTFLEGFWLLLIFCFISMVMKKEYLILSSLFIPFVIISFVTFCVTDITRSGSFIVPILFVLLTYLKRTYTLFEIRTILIFCCITTILIPPILVVTDWSQAEWFTPNIFSYIYKKYIFNSYGL